MYGYIVGDTSQSRNKYKGSLSRDRKRVTSHVDGKKKLFHLEILFH